MDPPALLGHAHSVSAPVEPSDNPIDEYGHEVLNFDDGNAFTQSTQAPQPRHPYSSSQPESESGRAWVLTQTRLEQSQNGNDEEIHDDEEENGAELEATERGEGSERSDGDTGRADSDVPSQTGYAPGPTQYATWRTASSGGAHVSTDGSDQDRDQLDESLILEKEVEVDEGDGDDIPTPPTTPPSFSPRLPAATASQIVAPQITTPARHKVTAFSPSVSASKRSSAKNGTTPNLRPVGELSPIRTNGIRSSRRVLGPAKRSKSSREEESFGQDPVTVIKEPLKRFQDILKKSTEHHQEMSRKVDDRGNSGGLDNRLPSSEEIPEWDGLARQTLSLDASGSADQDCEQRDIRVDKEEKVAIRPTRDFKDLLSGTPDPSQSFGDMFSSQGNGFDSQSEPAESFIFQATQSINTAREHIDHRNEGLATGSSKDPLPGLSASESQHPSQEVSHKSAGGDTEQPGATTSVEDHLQVSSPPREAGGPQEGTARWHESSDDHRGSDARSPNGVFSSFTQEGTQAIKDPNGSPNTSPATQKTQSQAPHSLAPLELTQPLTDEELKTPSVPFPEQVRPPPRRVLLPINRRELQVRPPPPALVTNRPASQPADVVEPATLPELSAKTVAVPELARKALLPGPSNGLREMTGVVVQDTCDDEPMDVNREAETHGEPGQTLPRHELAEHEASVPNQPIAAGHGSPITEPRSLNVSAEEQSLAPDIPPTSPLRQPVAPSDPFPSTPPGQTQPQSAVLVDEIPPLAGPSRSPGRAHANSPSIHVATDRSLPVVHPKHTSPKMYGRKKKRVSSDLPPADKPVVHVTGSGRISKRKRRDSAASMSSSGSSSASPDPLDDSYRPQLKPVGSKGQGKAKTNPAMKRLKTSRAASRSTSGQTSPSSSNMPITPPPDPAVTHLAGVKVIARWEGKWYPGAINGMENGKYIVFYYDGTEDQVSLDQLRRARLEIGDMVKTVDHARGPDLRVAQVWEGDETGVRVTGANEAIDVIPLQKLFIRHSIITSCFATRKLTHAETGLDGTTMSLPPLTSSPDPTGSSFAGKVFFTTSASSSRSAQRELGASIVDNGGTFIEDWKDLFALPSSSFGSDLKAGRTPFLLLMGDKALSTPKFLVSLAKGIPCLSSAYISAAIANPSVNPNLTGQG